MSSKNKFIFSWSILFSLWAVQGILFLWQFTALPSDTGQGLLFGYSWFRLTGIILVFLWIVFTSTMAIYAWKYHTWKVKRLDTIFTAVSGDILLVVSLLTAIVGQAALAVLSGLSQHGAIFSYAAYAARLAPLINLATLTGLELIGWIVIHRWQSYRSGLESGKPLFQKSLIMWGILGALSIFVGITGLGIVPDKTGEWGLPGVPLLEWQIALACIICVLTLKFEVKTATMKIKRLDLWISIGLWLGILLLWLGQPVNPGFSALEPRAPNFEIYPFSDAQVYDEFAQSLLIGNGLKGSEIPPRPLYIVFLTFLHSIVGQEYTKVIALQLVFLALLPVGLYWFGKEMFGRPVGIAVALLAGLREVTSNVAAPLASALSYSKLYLSEVPVAIALVFFTFLAIRWIRRNYPNHLAFVAGGILGIGIMIRTQAVVALPVLLVLGLLANWKKRASILRGVLLMSVAVAVIVSPWLWRNWKITGELIFDSPFTQTINLAQRYSRMNGIEADAARRPGETNIEYNDRLVSIFIEAVTANPSEAMRVVVNRFLNNCVDNILILPLRNDLSSVSELFQPSHAFWEDWRGSPTSSQSILLLFYLFLLGLGLAGAWNRLGLIGLLPLFINLVYNLWTSIALLAGQRFLVAMDWSIYTYYMIGLFVLLSGFMFLLNRARPQMIKWVDAFNASNTDLANVTNKPLTYFLFTGLIFISIGVIVPLSEKIFPQKFSPATQSQIFDEFTASSSFLDLELDPVCMQDTISDNHLIASRGRALSPRYYESGEGEYTDKLGYKPSEQPRLLFYITGDYYGLIILELNETPGFFPHASDVIVYRDSADEHQAWFVLVKDEPGGEIYFSDTYRSAIPCSNLSKP